MGSAFDVTGENCKWRSSELASTWCDIAWVVTYMKVWYIFSSRLYFYLYCVCILNSSMYKCWWVTLCTSFIPVTLYWTHQCMKVCFIYLFFIVLQLVTLYTSFIPVLLLLLDYKQGLKSHWTMAPKIGLLICLLGLDCWAVRKVLGLLDLVIKALRCTGKATMLETYWKLTRNYSLSLSHKLIFIYF